MIKLMGIFLLFAGGCAFHSNIDAKGAGVISLHENTQTAVYSKEINYWIDGESMGHGKSKRWVAGHWEVKMAIPDEDPGYRWNKGKWKRD